MEPILDRHIHLDLGGSDRSLAASCGTLLEQRDKVEELRENAQARDQNWPMLDRSWAKMAQDTSDFMPFWLRVNTLHSSTDQL
jgi:hypothetical protein